MSELVKASVDQMLRMFQAALTAAGCTPAQPVAQASTARKLHVSAALSGLHVLTSDSDINHAAWLFVCLCGHVQNHAWCICCIVQHLISG